jgi:hypothetical protein
MKLAENVNCLIMKEIKYDIFSKITKVFGMVTAITYDKERDLLLVSTLPNPSRPVKYENNESLRVFTNISDQA